MGLGSLNEFGLQEARQRAQDARKTRAEGKDPIEARNAERAAAAAARARSISFQKTAETFIADHEAGWKNQKHRDQWTNSLTATRTTEVIGAKWPEFNWATKVWAVPPERIKTAKEHRIPLSQPAIEMLKKRYEARTSDDAWVFPGRKPGKHLSNGALLALLDRMKRDAITSHGFRSTFRDWAGDETHYPNHVVEMALSHAIGDKVEAAYRRGDLFRKRRALMDDWASYALTPPKAPEQAQQASSN
jgi:integrase